MVISLILAMVLVQDDKEVERLIKQLNSSKTEEKLRACRDLSKIGETASSAAKPLCAIMARQTGQLAQAACEALEKVAPDIYRLAVILLVDGQEDNHLRALYQAGADEKITETLLPILLDYPSRIESLGKQAAQRRERPTGVLFHGRHRLTAKCLEILEPLALQEPQIIHLFYAYSASQDQKVREAATLALVELAEKKKEERRKVVEVLIGQLRDPHMLIAAIDYLSNLGPEAKKTLPTLRKMKLSSDAEIRRHATEAVEKLESP